MVDIKVSVLLVGTILNRTTPSFLLVGTIFNSMTPTEINCLLFGGPSYHPSTVGLPKGADRALGICSAPEKECLEDHDVSNYTQTVV